MNARNVVLLGVVTLIALVLALVMVRPVEQSAPSERQPLLPGLLDQVNDIGAIDIVAADGGTIASLRREQGRWVVLEEHGFDADFALVQDLLRDLATGHRLERRTANPQWYGRLGVADIGAPEASGLAVVFPDTALPSLIIGVVDASDRGRFVRLAGEAESWLSDRRLDLPSTSLRWLERAIMDIPASELSEVTVRHPDGDTVVLRAADESGEDWVLMNVPDGREVQGMWQLRPTANGLARLDLEAVRPHAGLPEEVVRALFVTRDGLNFVASLFEDELGQWVHFQVSAEPELDEGGQLTEAAAELAADAAAVDARLSPWQYRIDARKFEAMSRRREALLSPSS